MNKEIILINKYEDKINNINNATDMKILIREMFKDSELSDIGFNDLIYDNVIPRLKQLGFSLDFEKENCYEIVLKEEY